MISVIEKLVRERDESRAEVERLRAVMIVCLDPHAQGKRERIRAALAEKDKA
jgi:hypothetical protein